MAELVLDKNLLKNQLKQKIQERILASQQTKPDYSIGGFFKNLKSEAGDIIRGIGTMLGLGGRAIIHPIETIEFLTSKEFPEAIKMIGKGIIEDYKEYKQPFNKLYREPISVFTDFLVGAGLAGKGLKTAGEAAKIPELVKTGELATAISQPIKLAKESGTKIISSIPGGKEWLDKLSWRKQTIETLSKAQQSHLIERNKVLSEIDNIVEKLTPEEKATLIPYAEKRISLGFEPSENFKRAVELTRRLASEREELLTKLGKLTPEQIEARKWQPILKQLYGDEGDNLTMGLPKNSAVSDISTVEKTTTPLSTTEKIAEVKKLLKFPDDPIYVQHIFEDKPKKFADFFINTAPVKNWKPGFLKRSMGVRGYMTDPAEVLKWEAAQTIKYKNNIDLLEKIKRLDFVEPLDNPKNLKPGYKIFAPDGYIRFYQGTIDLVKEFTNKLKQTKQLEKVEDIWDSLAEAIDSSLLEKKYVGVTKKVKLYQVPENVARILQSYAKTTNPYVKLFWDKPIDLFRFLALAMTPRWLVNNIVGNMIFSIIAGDPLSPRGYWFYRTAKEQGLIPEDVFTGFYHTEKLMSGKLGKAAETKVGQLFEKTGKLVDEIPIISKGKIKIADKEIPLNLKDIGNSSYRINEVVDDFFRGSHYINAATKEARKKIIKETGKKLNDTIELLKIAKEDPVIMDKAIKSVEDFFYGASKLAPFERRVLRRFLPFYSWYKFITLYSIRLPLNHPERFTIIKELAKTFSDIYGQKDLPEYLRGSVPIGEAKDGSVFYLRTTGVNPFSLLQDLSEEGVEETLGRSVSPGLKTALERITGREAFLGRTYTAKDIVEGYNGRLYKFNPDTGKVEEVSGKIKPHLLEHLLRNFIPQYVMLEDAIAGGAQRFTAAGLPTLLFNRKEAIKTTLLGEEKVTKPLQPAISALGYLGLPITQYTPEQKRAREEAIQGATKQIFYQQYPQLSPQFKAKLREELKTKLLQNLRAQTLYEGIWGD